MLFLGSETPTLDQLAEQSWIWIVDMQKTCSLVIGYCLGGMLIGTPPTPEENHCRYWLSNEIFSSGIKNEELDIESLTELSYLATSNLKDPILATLENLPRDMRNLCKVAFNIPYNFDEAVVTASEDEIEVGNLIYEKFKENIDIEPWEFEDEEERILEILLRVFLITLLKQTGLLYKSDTHPAIKEVFKCTINLRQKLINLMCNTKFKEEEVTLEEDRMKDLDQSINSIASEPKSVYSDNEYSFHNSSHEILRRSLFLLLYVKGEYRAGSMRMPNVRDMGWEGPFHSLSSEHRQNSFPLL